MIINTIFLDIGMVLVGIDYEPTLTTLANLNGLSVKEIIRRLENDSVIPDYEKGFLTTEEFFEQITILLDIDISLERFEGIWTGTLVMDNWGSNDFIPSELFQQLKRNHRVIALSNTNEMQFDYLSEVYPLIREFDDYVLSHQVGHLKPDPEIYRRAIQQSGASPEESLFVDDLVENVKGAEQMGIRGLLFEGKGQLRQDLEKLKILCE